MAPPLKHHTARNTRRKASTRATLMEIDPEDVVVPELPKRYDKEGAELPWRLETQAWWEDIWSSPMSAEFHKSDTHGLYMLAALVDKFWSNPSKDTAAEIRLQRQAFGLTPLDRRRLEWTIEQADEAQARGEKRRRANIQGAPQPAASDDPRAQIA